MYLRFKALSTVQSHSYSAIYRKRSPYPLQARPNAVQIVKPPPSSHAAAGRAAHDAAAPPGPDPEIPRRRALRTRPAAAQDERVFLPCTRLRIALRFAGNIKSGVPLQERRLVDYCRVIS